MKKITINPKHLASNPDADVLKIKTERNSLGLLKTMLVALLILIQFAIFILSYLYFINFFQIFSVISYIITLITCLYCLSTNKNSQSKPIWIFFLLVCSSFGWIVYLLSQEKIFWRKNKKIYDKILVKSNKHVPQTNLNTKNVVCKSEGEYLHSAGNFIAYTDTDAKYFPSGTHLFDGMLEDLKNE